MTNLQVPHGVLEDSAAMYGVLHEVVDYLVHHWREYIVEHIASYVVPDSRENLNMVDPTTRSGGRRKRERGWEKEG